MTLISWCLYIRISYYILCNLTHINIRRNISAKLAEEERNLTRENLWQIKMVPCSSNVCLVMNYLAYQSLITAVS